MANSFHDFVKSHQETRAANWAEERDEWLRNLSSLYEQVESFLKEYVSKGEIRLKYRPVTLDEEEIGPYKAKQMVIMIGRKKVELDPIGRFVIGANGRVDVVGTRSQAQLLLVDRSAKDTRSLSRLPAAPLPSELAWKWVTQPPERKLVNLTKEMFHRLLMEVVNGEVNGQ
jgi:hypothetical protein